MTEKMTSNALILADYPDDLVSIACDRCDRRGQHRRGPLMALLGANAGPPTPQSRPDPG
jgi:hypothetical protein